MLGRNPTRKTMRNERVGGPCGARFTLKGRRGIVSPCPRHLLRGKGAAVAAAGAREGVRVLMGRPKAVARFKRAGNVRGRLWVHPSRNTTKPRPPSPSHCQFKGVLPRKRLDWFTNDRVWGDLRRRRPLSPAARGKRKIGSGEIRPPEEGEGRGRGERRHIIGGRRRGLDPTPGRGFLF